MTDIATGLIIDALDRVRETVHDTVDGLSRERLAERLDGSANSIAWLVWHLTRIEDDHIAGVAGREQVWHQAGWHDRFGLPLDRDDHGYGHTDEQVASVVVDADLLLGYHDAVHAAALDYLHTVRDDEMSRVVDTRWDPPVTLGVRLVSVVNDCTQHSGQAAFVAGILQHRAQGTG